MAIFGKLFYGFFGFLFSFFARFTALEKAAKLAQATTFLAAFAAIVASFMSCVSISGSCGSAIANAPAAMGSTWGKWVMMGLGVVFNSKTLAIFDCWLTVWLAVHLYVFKKKFWTMIL